MNRNPSDSPRSLVCQAFALLGPGAPRGAMPRALEDRDDGPAGEPHDPFVLVPLYASEQAAREAADRAAKQHGRYRLLLVELQLLEAVAHDERHRLHAMTARRSVATTLDTLADLYEAGADLVRLSGPEGEVTLIFTEALGGRVRIVSEAIVAIEPAGRSRLKDIAVAGALAIIAAFALKLSLLVVAAVVLAAALCANAIALAWTGRILLSSRRDQNRRGARRGRKGRSIWESFDRNDRVDR